MDTDRFRAEAHVLVDWIADYLAATPDRPVVPSVEPGQLRTKFPPRAPELGESFGEIMADLDGLVVPGLTGWQHPGWFAYFPGNSSPPSLLAEMATAAFGQQGMMWSTSPIATEMEMVVLDWLVDLLGLPEGWKMDGAGGGSIQVSASDSSHLALVIARHMRPEPTDRLVAYASAEAHSSVEKGSRVAGFAHFRAIPTDEVYALDPLALGRLIAEDRKEGLIPTFVCSTVGTTGTTAVDPISAVVEIAQEHGLWHHVDAAFAGSAMICPEFRHHQPDLEQVDSYVFNPHKWLATNFDCSVLYFADRRSVLDTLSITPPYLRNASASSREVVDYRDWQVALGRRFRALKLWWVIRSFGAEGLRAMIRRHVGLAHDLAGKIESHPDLELVAPVPFSLVCFRHRQGDQATQALVDAINSSGQSFVTPSVVDGRLYIRVSIGAVNTAAEHVDRLWGVIFAATRPDGPQAQPAG